MVTRLLNFLHTSSWDLLAEPCERSTTFVLTNRDDGANATLDGPAVLVAALALTNNGQWMGIFLPLFVFASPSQIIDLCTATTSTKLWTRGDVLPDRSVSRARKLLESGNDFHYHVSPCRQHIGASSLCASFVIAKHYPHAETN